MGERIADAGDDAIPLLLFRCRVVDQHACDEAAGEVTAVVPDQSVTKTRDDKETRGHPSIDDTLGRVFPPQKGCRRFIGIVRNRLNGEIRPPVGSHESRPVSGFRLAGLFAEAYLRGVRQINLVADRLGPGAAH